MKILSSIISPGRTAITQLALGLAALLLISSSAWAASMSFGSIPNPMLPGGTLNATSNFSMSSADGLSFVLTTPDLGAAAQIFVAAHVPAGTLGMTAPTWFYLTPDYGVWLPMGSLPEPVRVGAPAKSVWTVYLGSPDLNTLTNVEVYVGVGTSAQEMINASRFKGILSVR